MSSFCDIDLEADDINAIPFLGPRNLSANRPLFFKGASEPECVAQKNQPGYEVPERIGLAPLTVMDSEERSILQVNLEDLFVANISKSIDTLPVCSYILRKYLHIDSGTFRPRQQEVCLSVLQGSSTLAVCPTGWGKSMCYIFPMIVHRLLFRMRYKLWEDRVAPMVGPASLGNIVPPLETQSKFCLVISPLLALMADQSERVSNTACLNSVVLSAQTTGQRESDIMRAIAAPTSSIDIVFASPEKLISNSALRELLENQRHRLAMVCVDEVHCVSRWAYDFRPAFMYVNRVLASVLAAENETVIGSSRRTATPFLCLTATATKSVMLDLQRMFGITTTISCMDALRHNLTLESVDLVKRSSRFLGTDAQPGPPVARVIQEALVEAVQHLPKPLLVYVQTRSEADQYASYLAAKLGLATKASAGEGGEKASIFQKASDVIDPTSHKSTPHHHSNAITVRCYHAALSRHVRTATQNQFIRGEIDVLVATVAFGMGIDKANIRAVVHASAPSSLEAYAQETGRAGRDGSRSYCRLLFNPYDFFELRCRLLGSLLSLREVEAIVARLLTNPTTQYGDKLMLISSQKISEDLLVAEETVETILFMMLTSDATVLQGVFPGLRGTAPLGYRVQKVEQEDAADSNAPTNALTKQRDRVSHKRGRNDCNHGVGIGAILAQLNERDDVLNICREEKTIPNVVEGANRAKLSFNDFVFRLDDLVAAGTVKLSRTSTAFLLEIGGNLPIAASPVGQKQIAAILFQHYHERITVQLGALRTMFDVLQSPSHERVQKALKEEGNGSKAGCGATWQPPDSALKKFDAVSIANDFVEKNASRLTSTYEAARCLLGIMPRSVVKHGKYAGQIPLSLSWYVGSPYFGSLKEFEMEWVLAVLAPHNLDSKKHDHSLLQ